MEMKEDAFLYSQAGGVCGRVVMMDGMSRRKKRGMKKLMQEHAHCAGGEG